MAPGRPDATPQRVPASRGDRSEPLPPWNPLADELEAEWQALERTVDPEEYKRIRAFRDIVQAKGLDEHKACTGDGAAPHSRSASTLMRFLRARQGNPDAALKLFIEAMDWRRDFEIDRKLREWRSEWDEGVTPRVKLIRTYDFTSTLGEDNLGLPINLDRNSQGDLGGIVREIGPEAFLLHLVSRIEHQFAQARARMLRTGECICSFVDIQDVGNYGLVGSWLPRALGAVPFYKNYAPIFDKVYPERMRICFIVRAPSAFSIIWRLASPLVPEATKGKIRLKGFACSSWLEEMAEIMPREIIPAWLRTDDPASFKQAKPWGGIVPKGAIADFHG